MKIAFTTAGNDLSAVLDRRFGRAPGFLVFDTATESCEYVENTQNLNAAQGAGIQSGQTIARLGVEALVSGHCGPKAFRVLSAAGVKIYNTEAETVGEALELLKNGKLVEMASADVEGHWV